MIHGIPSDILLKSVNVQFEKIYLNTLINSSEYGAHVKTLRPDQLYSHNHHQIKELMDKLYEQRGSYDLITIHEHCPDDLKSYLTTEILAAETLYSLNRFKSIHTELLHRWLQREMMSIMGRQLKQLHENTIHPINVLNNWRQELTELSSLGSSTQIRTNQEISRSVIDRVKQIKDGTYRPTRLSLIHI